MSAKESLGYYEPKNHKPWFDEGCSKLLDQRKQAKLQWLQDPSELNGDNLNNIRRETSRHFRNKEREYLKDRINELAMNSKNKNIRDLYKGINYFKRGYQRSSNLVKDENGDLLADSHNILNRWGNYFSQLLNVHRRVGVIGPYFFEEDNHAVTVNSQRYVDMIKNLFEPALEELHLGNVWFQQDGATGHTARASMTVLRAKFPRRLISLRGDIPWAAHSPDLTPL
ncbi:hypothetical protein B7P43_G12066 [Cryptotermes secundus]|uniref:Tc1-like transposase DDE domain-containing protein n=1 Tax=Cryptotermes secundus TaxID=105785 RepID=A0A2J7PWZ0_9NEOP|nr:hypothetical protein B7P43_G12066 [Cryptotermes secundus]